jgi:hypothetical protein
MFGKRHNDTIFENNDPHVRAWMYIYSRLRRHNLYYILLTAAEGFKHNGSPPQQDRRSAGDARQLLRGKDNSREASLVLLLRRVLWQTILGWIPPSFQRKKKGHQQ